MATTVPAGMQADYQYTLQQSNDRDVTETAYKYTFQQQSDIDADIKKLTSEQVDKMVRFLSIIYIQK